MTNLKQQLEAMRDRMAEQHYKETGHVPTEWAVMNYQAGFNAAIPIILEMAKQAESLEELYYENPNVREDAYNKGVRDSQNRMNKALNKLKQFVDGGK